MVSCRICDASCSGEFKATDKKYFAFPNAPVCFNCYYAWVGDNHGYLENKIKLKFLGVRNNSGDKG